MYHAFLIAGQFLLAALLTLSATWWPVPWWVLLLTLPGIVLAFWAWLKMGLRRLRIHPTTNDRTRMLRDGPFALVRHPMYTGLLWFTAALLISGFAWWRVAAWFALLGVLVAKTMEEESAMSDRFPEYAGYRQSVGRLLPKWRRCQC